MVAGEKILLKCDKNALLKPAGGPIRGKDSTGTRCKWQVWLEEAEEAWTIMEYNPQYDENEHNHALSTSFPEQLASPRMREIPNHLKEFGNMLRKAGQGPAAINRFMRSVAMEEGNDITWTYDDIYNHFGLTSEEKAMDATNLANWISTWREHGHHATIHVSELGQLKRVYSPCHDPWIFGPKVNMTMLSFTT